MEEEKNQNEENGKTQTQILSSLWILKLSIYYRLYVYSTRPTIPRPSEIHQQRTVDEH